MTDVVKTYWSDDLVVTYDATRCIHAAECVRGLPGVFDTGKRPWIHRLIVYPSILLLGLFTAVFVHWGWLG